MASGNHHAGAKKGVLLKLRRPTPSVTLWRDRRAVTALEYGLIACFIVIAIISAVRTFGTSVSSEYQAVQNVYPH